MEENKFKYILDSLENKDETFNNLINDEEKKLNDIIYSEEYIMYIRDMNVSEDVLSLYEVEEILYHPSDINATTTMSKPEVNCRFLIYSKEFIEYNKEELFEEFVPNMDLHHLNILSCFKVVDITTVNNVTQIALLQYEDYEDSLRDTQKIEMEKKIKKESKKLLENSFNKKSIELPKIYDVDELDCGIGIILYYDTKVKKCTKDDYDFLIKVLDECVTQCSIEKTAIFTETYPLKDILVQYYELLEVIDDISFLDVQDIEEEIMKIIIDRVNNIDISGMLGTKEEINDIINSMDIPEDKKEIIKSIYSISGDESNFLDDIDIEEEEDAEDKLLKSLINISENENNILGDIYTDEEDFEEEDASLKDMNDEIRDMLEPLYFTKEHVNNLKDTIDYLKYYCENFKIFIDMMLNYIEVAQKRESEEEIKELKNEHTSYLEEMNMLIKETKRSKKTADYLKNLFNVKSKEYNYKIKPAKISKKELKEINELIDDEVVKINEFEDTVQKFIEKVQNL